MNISSNQVAALCLALTDGAVAAGTVGRCAGRAVKVGRGTVASLIRRGWLVPAYGFGENDYKLSDAGTAAAHVAFSADRGHDWLPLA